MEISQHSEIPQNSGPFTPVTGQTGTNTHLKCEMQNKAIFRRNRKGFKMRKIGKVIFKVVRFLYFKKLCPWFIWSPVYDHLHRL